MPNDAPAAVSPESSRWCRWRNGLAIVVMGLAVLAALAPLRRAEVPGRIGFLLIVGALLEILHGFRRSEPADQRSAWIEGGITLFMGWMLLHAPYFASAAVLLFLAGWFAVDAVRHFVSLFRRREPARPAWQRLLFALMNAAIAIALVASPVLLSSWAIAFSAAFRLFGMASNVASTPVFGAVDSGATVVQGMGLEQPELQEIAQRIAREEADRAPLDRGWIVGLVLVLLAIHVGRMGFDRTFLGVVAPGVAVAGDVLLGLILTFVLIVPVGAGWRWGTLAIERRLWGWCLGVPRADRSWFRCGVAAVLTRRLRLAIRLRQVRYSLTTALSRGMQTGLPLAAIIAATAPTFGLSWYFDTENWAAGMWNSWAAERTDDWREAMIQAEKAHNPAVIFAVHPPGVKDGEDFSFLVIGDTGEGDASQHVLRAQYLEVVRRPEVKFVVVSSDVVYPTGAMRDYEWKFWLPFMGTDKPVYAIPGNHDWYDANEGFNAAFLKPDSARRAMRARLDADRRISSTTDRRIEELIAQASRLREQYRVPTQHQEGPFFQFQTDRFALIAVDTGVMRRVDPEQMAWLKATLESAKGKTIMAILGHPMYAGGNDVAAGDEDFEAIRTLLRQHDVSIVMAGDTHDFEHYAEPKEGGVTHHFVNGGGGAYLSFGTALAWPQKAATAEWAYYPTTKQVSDRIEAATPWWKRPAWWWTKNYGAYPFSAEWLSALFDSNYAPFYQSFCEVKVEPAKNRIRVLPYGIHGRLRWSEMQTSADAIPPGQTRDDFAEWTTPLRR